ncbi:hypothetical protein ACFV20_19370 [Streptomyces sp. NPDC059696]|uniref:hypothetical protein n=1 Tax=Streptomyces sp. NPDC059696 TaxID=3346911 RepID=UPI0036A5F1C7
MAVHPVRSRSHGSSDVPTEYVIAYITLALIAWIIAAVAVARYEAADEHRGDGPPPPPNKEQLISGVMMGACAAVVWPLSLAAVGVWQLVRRLTQPQPTAAEETPGA